MDVSYNTQTEEFEVCGDKIGSWQVDKFLIDAIDEFRGITSQMKERAARRLVLHKRLQEILNTNPRAHLKQEIDNISFELTQLNH